MDRFIAKTVFLVIAFSIYLKSNMDRFIEWCIDNIGVVLRNLKSNMDRFIGAYTFDDMGNANI